MAAYRAASDPLSAASSHEEAAKKWDAVVPLAEEAASADASSPHFTAGRLVSRYKDQAADAKHRANWHRKQAQVMREIHGLKEGSIAAKDLSAYSHPGTQKSEPRAAILARGILAAVELRKAVPPEMEAGIAQIRAQQAGAKAIGVKKLYTGRHGTSQGIDPRKWDPVAHQEAADAYRHAADLSEKAGADTNHVTHAKMRAAEHDIKAKIAGHLQSGDHAAARAAIGELVALPHGNPDTKARLSALASKLR